MASQDWPADSTLQERSLAALFSKLDRDQNLDWLSERPEIQKVLAESMGQPVASITAALRAPVHELGPGSLLRLDDLPDARPIDLLRESLCPGLPRLVTEPWSFRADLWYAPGGAGRGLVARYLEQRGLCQVLRASTPEELRAALPRRGPLYLVYEGDVRALEDFDPPEVPVLVVVRARPRGCSKWHLVESPHPREYLADLVRWVSQRLPDDGSFIPDRALAWLDREPLARGLVPDLGSALGLCGLLDELGTRAAEGKSVEALARQFFKKRLSETAADQRAPVSWLKRQGLELMVGLVEQLLLDSERDWSSARSFDEWLDVVPEEHQRGTELDWMRMAFSQSDSTIRPVDLERAAERVPPGAFRIVRALEQSAFLRPDGSDGLALRPRWFGELLSDMARRSLLERSPLEWGELVLNPRQSARSLHELGRRLVNGDLEPVEATLELDADSEPAAVAALEACFLGVGLAVLQGVDFHPEQLASLYTEELRLLLEAPGALPRGRVLFVDSRDREGSASPPAHGHLLLAALAISEQLPRGTARPHELLRPWLSSEAPAGLSRVYDVIATVLDDPQDEWFGAAFQLVDRLRQAVGLAGIEPHRLELPSVILDEVEHEVLDFHHVLQLCEKRQGLASLLALADARQVAPSSVFEAIWRAWDSAGKPERGLDLFAPQAERVDDFWRAVPDGMLKKLLEATSKRLGKPAAPPILYRAFSERTWAAFVEVARETSAFWLVTEPWRYMPREVFVELLEKAPWPARSTPGLVESWQRFAKPMLDAVRHKFDTGQTELAWALVEASPREHSELLVTWLRQRVAVLDLDEGAMNRVRGWLALCIRRRDPGWRTVYAYLDEIEQGLAPLRHGR